MSCSHYSRPLACGGLGKEDGACSDTVGNCGLRSVCTCLGSSGLSKIPKTRHNVVYVVCVHWSTAYSITYPRSHGCKVLERSRGTAGVVKRKLCMLGGGGILVVASMAV